MKLVPLILGTATVALSCAASANTYFFSRSGPWEAFVGTDEGGHQLCGISTHWDDGRFFGIKRYDGDNYLAVQASRPSWQFDGGHVSVRFQMDGNPVWSARALTESGGHMLQFNVPLEGVRDFVNQLETSSRLTLIMGDNGVEWTIDLTGSADVARARLRRLRPGHAALGRRVRSSSSRAIRAPA